MNAAPANAITLSAAEFDAVFPFHVAMGGDGRITRTGRSLAKVAPAARPGVAFDAVFAPQRPDDPFETTRLRAADERLYTIRAIAGGVIFRGQMQVLGDGVVFLGSPWLGDTRDLEKIGLTLTDFAVHDPTLDLLQALQVQRIAADDLHRLADQLRIQSAQLESSARVKDTFLASMSHELRTPLVGILGLTESMIEGVAGTLNEKQARYLRIVEGSGRRLLALVNDILDLARIEAGQEQLAKHECLVSEICQASIHSVRPFVTKRRQQLHYDGVPNDLRMIVDSRRIKQALDNLLENASKFTREEGTLGLRVVVVERTLRFEVWDEGIGISADEIPRLFQPFVQLDGRLARRYDGSGLGLALVKQLVRLHQGDVEVISQPGKGSRFTLVIPAGIEPTAALRSPSVPTGSVTVG
ncbi:ATP-binding protein [Horticoccus sp. 23ND18S-11]|uniref:ATP-binding protein n=1 Tax=Horticoccus sp. 23ND18S-11 TaxID=3391832 RepID=UPI0039C9DD7E